mgnify:CR=1 FL=1
MKEWVYIDELLIYQDYIGFETFTDLTAKRIKYGNIKVSIPLGTLQRLKDMALAQKVAKYPHRYDYDISRKTHPKRKK